MKLHDLLDMLTFRYPRPAPGPTAQAFVELHEALVEFWLAVATASKLDRVVEYLAARLEDTTTTPAPQEEPT